MITSTVDTSDPYLQSKIKSDRSRFQHLTRLREVVFGAQDGIISTVTITTAIALAGASFPIVFIAGLTTALAGMISMGVGAYLGSQTEKNVEEAEVKREQRELTKDLDNKRKELILLDVQQGYTKEEALNNVSTIGNQKRLIIKNILAKKLGIVDAIKTKPMIDATVMGISFLISALIPLVPYMVLGATTPAIILSVVLSLLTLLILGILKGKLIKKSPIIQGMIILGIGTISAAVAYILGDIVPKIFGLS